MLDAARMKPILTNQKVARFVENLKKIAKVKNLKKLEKQAFIIFVTLVTAKNKTLLTLKFNKKLYIFSQTVSQSVYIIFNNSTLSVTGVTKSYNPLRL